MKSLFAYFHWVLKGNGGQVLHTNRTPGGTKCQRKQDMSLKDHWNYDSPGASSPAAWIPVYHKLWYTGIQTPGEKAPGDNHWCFWSLLQCVPVIDGSIIKENLALPLEFGTTKLKGLPLVLYLCTEELLQFLTTEEKSYKIFLKTWLSFSCITI